jgi:hypothetical protein
MIAITKNGRASSFAFFPMDTRAIALFRTLLGVLLAHDLLGRIGDLSLFYSDEGIVSRAFAIMKSPAPYLFSIHYSSGSVTFQIAIFLIHGVCIALFLVGYRPRLTAVLCWLFFVSVQTRNIFINQSSDTLLCQMLLWSVFLPVATEGWRCPRTVAESGTFVYGLMYGTVLFFAGIYKLYARLWQNGWGVYFSLANDFHSQPLARALLPYPRVLMGLNYLTMGLEIAAPLLLLIKTPRVRYFVLGTYTIFFISLSLCLRLGEFPWLMITALVPFIPGAFFDRLPKGFGHLAKPHPKIIPPRPTPSSIKWGMGLSFVALVLVSEATPFITNSPPAPLKKISDIAFSLRITENWFMFLEPIRDDGWFAFVGTSASGKIVNLNNVDPNADPWQRPPFPSRTYKDQRWLKLMQASIYNRDVAQHLALALLSRWNNTHGERDRLTEVHLYFKRKQFVEASYVHYGPWEKIA